MLTEAQTRLKNNEGKKALSFSEVMRNCGIDENDIENAGDLEIE